MSMLETLWMANAWTLIGTRQEVDQEGDREDCRIDRMTVTDGQVAEMALSLGKEPLAEG